MHRNRGLQRDCELSRDCELWHHCGLWIMNCALSVVWRVGESAVVIVEFDNSLWLWMLIVDCAGANCDCGETSFPCTTFQENTDFPSRFRTHLSSKYQHELPLTSVGLEQERTAWYGWTLGPILPTPTRSWATEQPTQTLGLTNINSSYFNKFFEGIATENMTDSSLKAFLPQLRTFLPMAWAWSYNRVILKLQKRSAVQIKIWIGEQLILISQGRSTFTYSKFYLFLEL